MPKKQTSKPAAKPASKAPEKPVQKEVVATAAQPTSAPEKAPKKASVVVSANPAQIQWPSDPWGFTREFRHAVVRMGQSTVHFADKRAIVEKTVEVALAFLQAKYDAEVAIQEAKKAKAAEDKAAKEAAEKPAEEPKAE